MCLFVFPTGQIILSYKLLRCTYIVINEESFFHWQRKKSEAPQHEDEVFELLFSHMALNLFTEPDQAIDILKVTRQNVNVKHVVLCI